jgi:hypothetical protein
MRPSASHAPTLWADVVVIVAFVVCSAVSVVVAIDKSDDEDAAAVVDVVVKNSALIQPGDRVLIHPPWRDDVVSEAITRLRLPPGATVSEAFTRASDGPWPPLVVIAVGNAPLPKRIEERRLSLGVEVVAVGDTRIFRLPAAQNEGGLNIATAAVSVEATGRRVQCPWNAQRRRHVCPGLPQWMTVGEDTLQIGGRGERCFWSHPISGGRVVVDFGIIDVSAGLDFAAALSDGAVDNRSGAAVDFELIINDSVAARLKAHRRKGFQRASVDGSVAGNGAPSARVKVVVSTDNDGQRHACFRLATRSR